jgi:hypothetical protein
MPNLLETHGARPQKEPKFVPLFIDKAFTGLFTQRAALHDPSDLQTKFYAGGRPDSLWMGSNVELTNRLTFQRRPGLSPFSTVTYPTAPDRAFPFELINGTIQVVIDTGSTGNLSLSSVVMSSGGMAVYIGTFPNGGSNAYVGMIFKVSGFLTTANNGNFACVASSTTTLTLLNASATPETDPAVAISAGAVYVDNQNGTKTILFGKSPGAGQAYFVAVAGVLYMGDGVDTNKYTPLNLNGIVWKWGITAPAAQPGVVITQSGVSAVNWAASTWFSSMGVLIDSNGNIQQLVSVNADGTNPSTPFGLSGNGAPNWASVSPGSTIVDGTVTWLNSGPIGSRFPNTTYNGIGAFGIIGEPAAIYDPTSHGFYENSYNTPQTTSSASTIPFTGTVGDQHFDGTANWVCFANAITTPQIFKWQKNHAYPRFFGTGVDSFGPNSCIVEPFVPPFGVGQIPFLFICTVAGTSQATPYVPQWATSTGFPTVDGQLKWVCLGSATRQNNTQYSAWTSPTGSLFNVVKDPDGNLHVCIQSGVSASSAQWHSWQSNHAYLTLVNIIDTNGYVQTVTTAGTSGGAHPVWNTTVGGTTVDNGVTWKNQGSAYGFHTADGGVIWSCVGTAAGAVWAASQSFYLPATGFSAPTSSDPFGGADIVDSNSNVQFVLNTGVSGTPTHPVWAVPKGGLTADNTVLWYNNGVLAANSLSWTKGHVYAYSYKARSLTDFYSVNVAGTNVPPVPPGLTNPLPAPTGSETNAISTASPVFTIIGSNAGAVNTISGIGSPDPQVDTIVIWRDADGGGAANMFELTEIPAPAPINGIPQPWSFQDFLPDTPTATFPGLNTGIPAPINGTNNPPLPAFLPMVYNFQRIWGALGQSVAFSGGPDVVTGSPNEAFNIADELPFLANVINIVKNTQGLVTFLTNSIELIAGGPITSSFFSVQLCPAVGLLSFNFLDVHAGEIYFFSADNQFYAISPSLNLSRAGFPIGDQFANLPSSGVSDTTWNSANGYITVHQNGIDNCIMVADGATGWYRLNPYQTPGGGQGPEPIWSPYANITNGCKMVQSIETAPGVKKLLVGATTGGKQILFRDLTNFTDNGTQYGAFFIMGSVMLVHPGQLAVLKFLEMDYNGHSFRPTVSFLLNEIAGTFTPFTLKPQFDPPSIYGTTGVPGSYSPNRYYFSGTKSLARCRHLQIKVDFGKTSNGDELFNLTMFGRLMAEF